MNFEDTLAQCTEAFNTITVHNEQPNIHVSYLDKPDPFPE